MIEFESFNELTHAEILDIIVENLCEIEDGAKQNRLALEIDRKSVSLRNRGKEISAALTTITGLLEDLGIDVDEIERRGVK